MNKIFLLLILAMTITSLSAQKYGSAAELLVLMEKSSLSYQLGMLEKEIPAKEYKGLNSSDQYQVEEKGKISVEKYSMGEAGKKAESLYKQGKYGEARLAFQKVANNNSENAHALTRIGQCFQKEGDLNAAKNWLEKARDQNFHDYEAHWALANIYFGQKETTKAIQSITTAHILNRNHRGIKENLDKIYMGKGLKTGSWVVTPQYTMAKEGKTVDLKFEQVWMNYALPQAVRKYEGGTGESALELAINPAIEGFMSMYQPIMRDAALRRTTEFSYLKKALEGNQIDSYAYYELVLREKPQLVFELPEKTILHIGDYLINMRSAEVRRP